MTKLRVIPNLLKRGPSLVKGPLFSKRRVVGPILPLLRVYQSRNIDELALQDVSSLSSSSHSNRFDWVKSVSSFLTMPLSVGGGIRSASEAHQLIKAGADKVIINSLFFKDLSVLAQISNVHGSQSVVLSIDVYTQDGSFYIYDSWKNDKTGLLLSDILDDLSSPYIGEILLTSVSHEGLMSGFDLALFKYVAPQINVPLVFSGGGGNPQHFLDLVEVSNSLTIELSGIAASSCFLFTKYTPLDVSAFLQLHGHNTRVPALPS